jgi:hypothetical protein
MRKPVLPGLLVGLLGCAAARAGTFVEVSRTDLVNLLRPPETQKLWFDEGKLRIENERADAIQIFKDDTLFLIEPAQQRYTVLEPDGRDTRESGALALAAEPTPGATPRAAATAVLTHLSDPAAPASTTALQPTPRSESVAGLRCRIWELVQDHETQQQLCIVPVSALPRGDEIAGTMRASGMALAGSVEQVAGATRESVAGAWSQLKGIDGLPVLVRLFQQGRAVTEYRITGWRTEPIPSNAFEVPSEYKSHRLGTHSALAATAAERAAQRSHHPGS